MRKIAAAVFLLVIIGLMVLCVAPAFAQDAGTSPADVADFVVGWVCSNQDWVKWALTLALMHFGFSAVSAVTKKLGLSSDNPLVRIIRILAMDVKPAPAMIVAEADAIRPPPLPQQAVAPPPRPTVVQP